MLTNTREVDDEDDEDDGDDGDGGVVRWRCSASLHSTATATERQ